MGFFDFMTEDIAIDLGTANTLIMHKGKVVIDSPSIVARDRTTGKIIAIGKEANLMQGKTHENIKTIRPLKDGVIADFQASEEMIKEFVKQIPSIKKKLFPPALRMVICIPYGITEVEKTGVRDSSKKMNAKEINFIY
jgi:rod shape-determining protein MreB and related proteins